MRNIRQYPITREEQIQAVKDAAAAYDELEKIKFGGNPPIGGVTRYALSLVLEDLMFAPPRVPDMEFDD